MNDGNESVQLPELLDEFRTALEKEIEAVRKGGQSSTLLSGGREVPSNTSDFWYKFNVDFMPDLPADTPCKLTVGAFKYDVTVIQVEDSCVTIASDKKLTSTIGKARLDNGSTVLMERLIKRIEDNASTSNPAANRMIPATDGTTDPYEEIHSYSSDELVFDKNSNEKQTKAINSALNNNITYIWGPPGTGKTTVIKDIIWNLMSHNRSVLLVSHTNTAVDGAIKKVDKKYFDSFGYEDDHQYPILRLGNIADQDVSERIRIDNHVKQAGKDLQARKDELEASKINAEIDLAEIRKNLFKINWLDSNRVADALILTDKKNRLEAENKKKEEKIVKLKKDIIAIEEQYPDCNNYLFLAKQLKAKQEAIDTLNDRITRLNEIKTAEKKKSEEADIEIKKWDKYSSLSKELGTLLPEAVQKDNLDRLWQEIKSAEQNLEDIKVQIEEAKATVENNKNRGAISGFLSKRTVQNAESLIEKLSPELVQLQQGLEGKQVAHASMEQEYIRCLGIQDQLRILSTSKTREEWIGAKADANLKASVAEEELSELTPLFSKANEEIRPIAEKAGQFKAPFLEKTRLSNEINKIEKELEKSNPRLVDAEIQKILVEESTNVQACLADRLKNYVEVSDPLSLNSLTTLVHVVEEETQDLDYEELEEEQRELLELITEIKNEIKDLETRLAEIRKEVVLNVKVLGTTLAKSYLDDVIQQRKFDTVILDEASMASIPALWCASLVAENNIVIVGDFMQLPPIVIASGNSKGAAIAKKWLGRDIFEVSGMKELLRKNAAPDNFIALTSQYRMEPEIAEIANAYYGEYNTTLKSPGANADERNKDRDAFYAWYPLKEKKPLHIVDTSNLHAWATGVPTGRNKSSRLNYFSASLCVEMAFRFLADKLNQGQPDTSPSVIIIAQYRPHIKRIQELVRLKYKTLGLPQESKYIDVGTVHSFQGKEADIVIFDLVVDEPHWSANIFITNNEEVDESTKKLFNVAVTRAKYKLFVVGNIEYYKKRTKNNALSTLLNSLEAGGAEIIDAKEHYPELAFSMNLGNRYSLDDVRAYLSCDERSFYDYICEDIRISKQRIIIYSPFMTESRIGTFLPHFSDALSRGVGITIITKPLSEHNKKELTAYSKCESILKQHGIMILHKKGMHEKNIIVDSDVMWCGSLNMLSYTGNTGEYMLRINSRAIVKDSIKDIGVEELLSAAHQNETKCPICGSEIIMAEGQEGGFYWKCTKCDYSRNRNEQYPHDGIIRCEKCGSLYQFNMINEPRWVCESDPKHFRKLRISDLYLEKMENLITKKDMKRIKKYYKNSDKEAVVNAWMKYENHQKEQIQEDNHNPGEQLTIYDISDMK